MIEWGSIGVPGAFAYVLPEGKRDDAAVASVYAEVARRFGWLRFDRVLTESEQLVLVEGAGPWAAECLRFLRVRRCERAGSIMTLAPRPRAPVSRPTRTAGAVVRKSRTPAARASASTRETHPRRHRRRTEAAAPWAEADARCSAPVEAAVGTGLVHGSGELGEVHVGDAEIGCDVGEPARRHAERATRPQSRSTASSRCSASARQTSSATNRWKKDETIAANARSRSAGIHVHGQACGEQCIDVSGGLVELHP